MDASNLLKPALARGELHCVGATTLDEYRKHVEKDAALARRFQPVYVPRADGRGHHLDPARAEGEIRAASRRAHLRCRAGRRRDAVEPLHHRPLPARQGDRPGRRGGVAAAHAGRLQARGARRARPPPDAAQDRARGAEEGEGHGVQGPARQAREGDRQSRGEGERARPDLAAGEGEARLGARRSRSSSTPRASSSSRRSAAATSPRPASSLTA